MNRQRDCVSGVLTMGCETRRVIEWQRRTSLSSRLMSLVGAIALLVARPAAVVAQSARLTNYGVPNVDAPSLAWAVRRYQVRGIRNWQIRPSERAVVLTVVDTWPRQPYLDRYRAMDVLGTTVSRHRYHLVAMTEGGTVVGRYICMDDLPDSPRLMKEKSSPQERRSPCQLSLKIETPLVMPPTS